ncbi:MAG: hypothetical protein KBH06_10225 [Spirochaetes bacterium]|nr:hypothetical protein [Spirochaetota bacterium]
MSTIKILFLFVILLSSSVFAAYKPKDSASVLWQNGIIRAESHYSAKYDRSGVPLDFAREKRSLNGERMSACAAASENAREKIAFLVNRIRLDSDRTIGEFVKSNSEAQEKLAEILDEKIKLREQPKDFFSAKTSAELKISELIRALPLEFPNEDFPVPSDKALPTYYSSLIIDARGIEVSPMILPSVYDEDGLEIYGRYFINPAYAVREGLVTYCFSEKEAERHKKAGDSPYFAPAVRGLKGNPVILHRDIKRILSDPRSILNLKKCRVIFIIDGSR